MYPAVIKVVPCDDYLLHIDFDNGESGKLDIKPILNFGIFKRINNHNTFKQVKVSFDTIEWSCGVDLDPEYVYTKCVKNKIT